MCRQGVTIAVCLARWRDPYRRHGDRRHLRPHAAAELHPLFAAACPRTRREGANDYRIRAVIRWKVVA